MLPAIIGAVISLAANAIGSAVGNSRKRRAEEAYRREVEGEIEGLDNEIEGNYLDRADSQNVIRKTTEANKEALRQLNTEAIRSGATDEAKVAMASELTQGQADVIGNLAALGEQHKDRLKEERRRLRLGLAEKQYASDSDVSGINTMVSTISSAANSLTSAWDSKRNMPHGPVPTVGSEAGRTYVDNNLTAEPQVKYGELKKTW